MSNRTKQRRSGGLTLLLYQRTLHPELFKILATERVSRRAYDAEIWLVEGGHVITLTAGENTQYMISTQEEQLTQTLYDATKYEIATYASKRELMSAETPSKDESG